MLKRSGWRRSAVVAGLVVLMAAGSTVAATRFDGAADSPTRTAVRLDPPRRAVVIGDSAIAALRWVPRAESAIVGFEHTLDLESCRRLYSRSCDGREGRTPPTVYEALGFHGGKFTTLVVATGYNDSDYNFAKSFRLVVERARTLGFERIVWWTLRSDVDYVAPGAVADHRTFAINNQIVRDLLATGDYPDVVLADWGAYTAGQTSWFVTDGVHYRSLGAWAAADYLTRKMAFLDNRPCPVPTAPDLEPENPCPDPDLAGPVTDLRAIYPIGTDGVLCYEIGVDRRFECRTEYHVIQLERELAYGATGDDVEAVQTRLIRLGLLADSAPGSVRQPSRLFDVPTFLAVQAFQLSATLPATGIADVATLDALGFDTAGIAVVTP